VWGGNRLKRLFNFSMPAGKRIGESWEIADCEGRSSQVLIGPLKGKTLHELLDSDRVMIMGDDAASAENGFPLLFKLIDAAEYLSVQVHPSDATAPPGKNGKSEAWVILYAEPDARIIRGLKAGVTRDEFTRMLNQGKAADCLNEIQVKPGDVIDLPAGTVHALGGGIVLAEIQQSSNVTYRLYDWDRSGLDGKPRQLHIEEALEVMNFDDSEPFRVEPEIWIP